MEDVARAAGVSRSTVSRALQNHPRLPSSTKERVCQLAGEMGYRPHPMIAALMAELKSGRGAPSASTLGYLTAHPTRDGWEQPNPSFKEYFLGARDRAAAQGFVMEIFWLREPGMTVERFHRMLNTRQIRGVLIAPQPEPHGVLELPWDHYAAVAIGHTLKEPALSRVVPDFYLGNLETLGRLQQEGYRRIGFATDAKTHERVHLAWLAAYLVFQQSLPARRRLPPYICPGLSGEGLADWIRLHRPDAIVGTQNQVLSWVNAAGGGGIKFASLNTGRSDRDPPGIDQQSRLVGATGVDLIIAQMHRNELGIPAQPMMTLIPGVWRAGPGC
jgi:LacI family transcriptional regulator